MLSAAETSGGNQQEKEEVESFPEGNSGRKVGGGEKDKEGNGKETQETVRDIIERRRGGGVARDEEAVKEAEDEEVTKVSECCGAAAGSWRGFSEWRS